MNLSKMRTAIAAFPETMHAELRQKFSNEAVTDLGTAIDVLQTHGAASVPPESGLTPQIIQAARATLTAVLSAPPGENEGKKRGRPKGSKNRA